MAERVLLVRRLARELESDQCDDRGAGIRQVVDGVGRDGDAVEQRADRDLHREQQQIGHDADKPRHAPALLAHRGVLRILVIAHKQLQNQVCQRISPFMRIRKRGRARASRPRSDPFCKTSTYSAQSNRRYLLARICPPSSKQITALGFSGVTVTVSSSAPPPSRQTISTEATPPSRSKVW